MNAVRRALTQAIADWWYGLVPFALINLIWFLCVVTVVAGPPATAALLFVARDAAVGLGTELSTFFAAFRRYFKRAWALGAISAAGTLVLTLDLLFYANSLRGVEILSTAGVLFLLYALIMWIEFLLIAWPVLVDQPEMGLRHVLRNSAVVALRLPGANLLLALVVFILTVLSVYLSPLLALVSGALVALLVQHYLHAQVPALANFPPPPGSNPPAASPDRPRLWAGE